MLSAAGRVQWGDVATWLSGTGTILAFGATLILLTFNYNQLRMTRDDQRQRDDDRRRSQARLVTAWPSGLGWRRTASDQDQHFMSVNIRNRSEEPVYDLTVTVEASEKPVVMAWGSVPFPPQHTHTGEITITGLAPTGGYPPVLISFLDSAGRKWVRDGRGVLREQPTDLA
jgi:hypothetical protein